MKRNILLLMAMVSVLLAGAITVDEVPNVHRANKYQYVSNPSGILSVEAVKRLNDTIRTVWAQTSAELVVVVVDEVDSSMTPAEFATKLFEKWGIGKKDKDNGVLLLVSRDDRQAQIRTGYGVEGALPDIIAGRIIRNLMAPEFRDGNYDAGTIAGVDAIARVLKNPELGDELTSKYANDSLNEESDLSAGEFFTYYLWFALFIALGLLFDVCYVIYSTRNMDDVPRYRALDSHKTMVLFAAFLSLGMGVIPYLMLKRKMHSVRRHKRDCPNCGTRMELIDEEHDNDYLTPAQDTEEKLNSIDYDVWHCPKCHEVEVLPYINRDTKYTVCPQCGARAVSLVEQRTLRHPTIRSTGEGVNMYMCRNCGNRHERRFTIPRREDDSGAVVAGAILGGMMGGRGGGGGGFSGGSFGGGMTGGGGAGGSW